MPEAVLIIRLPEQAPVEPARAAPEATAASDNRRTVSTTIRIDVEKLKALKVIAADKRVRVNDLLIDGAGHILAIDSKGV